MYRRELRPVITTGAEIMDDVFRRLADRAGEAGSWPTIRGRDMQAGSIQESFARSRVKARLGT